MTNFCIYNEIPNITPVKTNTKYEKHLNKYYKNKLKFKFKKTCVMNFIICLTLKGYYGRDVLILKTLTILKILL